MHSLSGPDHLKMVSLLWRGIGKAPRPSQRDTDGTSVGKLCRDDILGHFDCDDAWLATHYSVHLVENQASDPGGWLGSKPEGRAFGPGASAGGFAGLWPARPQ